MNTQNNNKTERVSEPPVVGVSTGRGLPAPELPGGSAKPVSLQFNPADPGQTAESQLMLPGFEQPADASESVTLTEALAMLQSENAELRVQMRVARARESLTSELDKAGARTPAILFEVARQDLQFDDAGKPTNIAALVEKLRTSYPEQFGTHRAVDSIDGGAGRIATPTLTKADLARMKPAEIAALDWAEVRRVLAGS